MRTLPFVKMTALGNDYVYLDACVDASIEAMDLPALARAMSDRRRGIGGDGLILLARPTQPGAQVRMRTFNADGSEAQTCGNALRCVAKLACERLGVSQSPMVVQTLAGAVNVTVQRAGGVVVGATVDMGRPKLESSAIPTTIPQARVIDWAMPMPGGSAAGTWAQACGLDPRLTCVSMGNPHAVLFCADVGKVPLEQVGPQLERAPLFPQRINVHFAQVVNASRAIVRTWERGSGITHACGSGACAVLVAGALTGRLERRATIAMPGGELDVAWEEWSEHVMMSGPCEECFTGVWTER